MAAMTIGMTLVAIFAAIDAAVPDVTSTSTLSPISSAIKPGMTSMLPSAQR